MNKKSVLTGTLVALIGASSLGSSAYSQESKPEYNPLVRAVRDCAEGKIRPYKPHPMESELRQYEKNIGLELTVEYLSRHDGKTMTSGTAAKALIQGYIAKQIRDVELTRAEQLKREHKPYKDALSQAVGFDLIVQEIDYQLLNSNIVTDK